MPKYYEYLLSSLPMLSFGMKAPLSFDRLVYLCKGLVTDKDIETLRAVTVPGGAQDGYAGNRTLAKWRSFDTMLRNELVTIRAQRKKQDPVKYLRQDGSPESAYTAHIAINAYRKPSILESEKALDLERWHELDELASGHHFDLDALVVYALKLMILVKWDAIRAADKGRLLEEVLSAKDKAGNS